MLNRLLYLLNVLILFFGIGISNKTDGQCTDANINWENLDFLVLSGAYTPFVSSALVQNQNFAMGKNRMTFLHNYNSSNSLSENISHTGETGTFGTRDDVQFIGNGEITFNFATAVQDLKFSLYDIDYGQRAAFSAFNGATALNVNLATLTGTILTISNNNTTTARVDAAATTAVDLTSTDGAVNVTIAGPVTSITITLSNTGTKTNGPAAGREDGSFWVSDINACVTGDFPTNYYEVSRPFTGQPGYILSVVDNNVYYTNPADGVSKLLFTDPGHTNINSLAYDPYNRIVYYTYSLTGTPQNERAIRKYDVNTEVISVNSNDVYANLNIPTYENGVTSGAAAFYDGAYYIGIEGYNSGTSTGRKSLVWRIDFDGSLNPIQSSQVYGSNADNGTTTIHDWSDIGIYNGILYDFDGAATNPDIYHYNLQTGDSVHFAPITTPRQVGVDWQGELYNVTETVQGYDKNGNMGTAYSITSTPAIPGGGSWGDGAEAFRPLLDFGDAPATYDPDTWSPAVHERDTALRIGATWDREWLKRGVTGVEDIDDGLAYVPILAKITGGYFAQVNVWNNTGADATLCAWLDYDGNGIFDVGEGIAPITISSMPSMQTPYIVWTGITTPLSNGSFTYLRIRLTSASNVMTAANPTGYFNDGETEDYSVLVDDFPLKADLLNFTAKTIDKKNIELNWTSIGELNFKGYEVQRSTDNNNWIPLNFSTAIGNGISTNINYIYNDRSPLSGKSYYRLKLVSNDDKYKYSEVRMVTIRKDIEQVTLLPNPAITKATILINATIDAMASINIMDVNGRSLYNQKSIIRKGLNNFDIPEISKFISGFYFVQVEINGELFVRKLIVNKE